MIGVVVALGPIFLGVLGWTPLAMSPSISATGQGRLTKLLLDVVAAKIRRHKIRAETCCARLDAFFLSGISRLGPDLARNIEA